MWQVYVRTGKEAIYSGLENYNMGYFENWAKDDFRWLILGAIIVSVVVVWSYRIVKKNKIDDNVDNTTKLKYKIIFWQWIIAGIIVITALVYEILIK